MQISFTEKKNIRKSFGKLKESLSIPNLIEVQKNSYNELTEFFSQSGDLFIPRRLIHEGDLDTFIEFTDDDINIKVGNINFMDFTQDTVSELTINEAAQDLDMPLFIHPWEMMGMSDMIKYWLPWLV